MAATRPRAACSPRERSYGSRLPWLLRRSVCPETRRFLIVSKVPASCPCTPASARRFVSSTYRFGCQPRSFSCSASGSTHGVQRSSQKAPTLGPDDPALTGADCITDARPYVRAGCGQICPEWLQRRQKLPAAGVKHISWPASPPAAERVDGLGPSCGFDVDTLQGRLVEARARDVQHGPSRSCHFAPQNFSSSAKSPGRLTGFLRRPAK